MHVTHAGRSKLLMVPGTPVVDFEKATYYKIPFWQATDLVGNRQVSAPRFDHRPADLRVALRSETLREMPSTFGTPVCPRQRSRSSSRVLGHLG